MQKTPMTRTKKIIIIGISVILIIALASIVSAVTRPTEQSKALGVANSFVKQFITKPNASKAYALTSSSFKKAVGYSSFSKDSARLHGVFKESFKYKSSRVFHDGGLQFSFLGNGSDGKYTFSVLIIQEEKTQKVQYYVSVKN